MQGLRYVSDYGQSRATENLGFGLADFINHAYLDIGAFVNVALAASGAYGGDHSQLHYVNHPNYASGRVWQGLRANWVYETDVSYGTAPLLTSGVFVNGAFQPSSGVGTYQHYIDYPNGYVVFNSGIPTSSVVKCPHSFKQVNIYNDDAPWFREFQAGSLRIDSVSSSGNWNLLSKNRVQLPAIIIQPLTTIRLIGIEIGGGNKRHQNVLLHIYTENPWEKRAIADDLINMKNHTFMIWDRDKVFASGVTTLDAFGARNPNGLSYNSLIEDSYKYRQCYIHDVTARDVSRPGGLSSAVISWTIEVII
jgi:hypothetical protein